MSIKIENEIKIDSDPCVAAWDNQLFAGAEDGSIKVKCLEERVCFFDS